MRLKRIVRKFTFIRIVLIVIFGVIAANAMKPGHCQEEALKKTIKTVSGAVTDVDWVGSSFSIDNSFTIRVPKGTRVFQGTESLEFSDIEISDTVTVRYYTDDSGSLIAESIDVQNTYPAF